MCSLKSIYGLYSVHRKRHIGRAQDTNANKMLTISSIQFKCIVRIDILSESIFLLNHIGLDSSEIST